MCACTEGMSSDSARCYPSCCLNVLRCHRQLLYGAPGPRVCARTTFCTYSNGPFSLMVPKASLGGDEYPMRKEGLGAVKVYNRRLVEPKVPRGEDIRVFYDVPNERYICHRAIS